MALPHKDWLLIHNDYYHPSSREECDHCQEMISLYGEMPSRAELAEAEKQENLIARADNRAKANIPPAMRWEVWERDNFTCVHCGARRFLTIDHIHPESRGGATELNNLQTLCKTCNSRKGTKL